MKTRYEMVITFDADRPLTDKEIVDLRLSVPFWLEDERCGEEYTLKFRRSKLTTSKKETR